MLLIIGMFGGSSFCCYPFVHLQELKNKVLFMFTCDNFSCVLQGEKVYQKLKFYNNCVFISNLGAQPPQTFSGRLWRLCSLRSHCEILSQPRHLYSLCDKCLHTTAPDLEQISLQRILEWFMI